MLDHEVALSKAKIQLMASPSSAFYTTLCFSLKTAWKEDIGTAGTNGRTIYFSPKFFMGLTPAERVFLLLHETLHCAYMHMDRKQTRDHRKWNIAGDYVINQQLTDAGFTMPAKGLLDQKYKGMSTDEVYNALPEKPQEDCDMDLMPAEGTSEELQAEMQDILVRAAIQSKMAGDKPGTIPGDIEIFLDRLLNPKLPWNRILQRYLRALAKSDYTFKKPNRRFFPKHHLPSLQGEALMNIAIAVDTSGSVSDEDFNRFVTEVNSILKMMKPEKIDLIQFDTDIKSVTAIRNVNDLMHCKFTGRGGTSIGPVIDWANKNSPQLLLVFSDGEFYFHDQSTKVNTLWIIHNNASFVAPMGKTIHYEI